MKVAAKKRKVKAKPRVRLEDGTLVQRHLVAKVDGKYHYKKDLIEVDGKLYTKDTPYLVKDYITKKYFFCAKSCTGLIVNSFPKDFTKDSSEFNTIVKVLYEGTKPDNFIRRIQLLSKHKIDVKFKMNLGYGSTRRLNKAVTPIEWRPVPSSSMHIHVTKNFIKEQGLVEDISKGVYVSSSKQLSKNPAKYKQFNNSAICFESRLDAIKFGSHSVTNSITEGLKTRFGVEIETSRGIIPTYMVKNLNVDCVYDGSLKTADGEEISGEYVTGVLTGDAGFHQLYRLSRMLAKRCQVDKKCSVHVHVNVNPTKEFIVSFFLLCLHLEEEIFSFLPPSRRNNDNCARMYGSMSLFDKLAPLLSYTGSDKEYYNVMLSKVYAAIYDIIRLTPDSTTNIPEKMVKFPKGDKGGWRKGTPRYWWINFIPALFSRDLNYRLKIGKTRTKYPSKAPTTVSEFMDTIDLSSLPHSSKSRNTSKHDAAEVATIEFRNHSATLNYVKIQNWVKFCIALTTYAERNYRTIIRDTEIVSPLKNQKYMGINIKGVNLESILNETYPKSGGKLYNYFRARQESLKKDGEGVELNEYNEFTNPSNKDIKNSIMSLKELISAK